MLVDDSGVYNLRSKSVSPLTTSNDFVEGSEHQRKVLTFSDDSSDKLVGVKPGFVDNKPMISKYGASFKTILSPLTNQLYKYNIRNKYIKFINQTATNHEGNVFMDSFVIDKPSFDETIDFSSIDHQEFKIIGLLSSWIDLGTKDALINKISFNIITNELQIAHYNRISNVVISPPKNVSNVSSYCEILNKVLNYIKQNELGIFISISLPIITTDDLDYLSTWELWLKIKTLCNHNRTLNISLALLQSYSSENLDFLNKWIFEPVDSLLLSSSIFLPNKFQQPVLNKLNQLIVKKFQLLKKNNIKILLHGLEKHPENAKSYIDYVHYITQQISKELEKEQNIKPSFKETLYSEVQNRIEQNFQIKLDAFLDKRPDKIHILIIKPELSGHIIKLILKILLDRNERDRNINFRITVFEDNFANFNNISYLNKNKWNSLLTMVDSLTSIKDNIDIVLTDNITRTNIHQYIADVKLLPYATDNTQYVPDEIVFKLKPIYKQDANKKAVMVLLNENNYLSLANEKEYNDGQSMIFKINKKQQYNGIVLNMIYRISDIELKVSKYILPVDYHYLCKDTELELNVSIVSVAKEALNTTEISYTSSCYIYLINEQYGAIPKSINDQKEQLTTSLSENQGPMFDIASGFEEQMEFHERCMLWCERLYNVVI